MKAPKRGGEMAIEQFAYVLDKKGGAQKVPLKRITLTDKNPVWIHLDSQEEEDNALLKKYKINPTVLEHLLSPETAPRCVRHAHGLMVTLRGLNVNQDTDDELVAVHIWLTRKCLITVASQPVAAVEELADLLRRKRGPKGAGALLVQLAHLMIKKIKASLTVIAEQADDLEDRVIEEKGIRQDKKLREDLSHLRHLIVSFRRFLVPQQPVMQALEKVSEKLFTAEDKAHLHTLSRDLDFSVEKLNFARDHSSVTQDQLDAKTNTNISQIMYLMSLIMVIFIEISF